MGYGLRSSCLNPEPRAASPSVHRHLARPQELIPADSAVQREEPGDRITREVAVDGPVLGWGDAPGAVVDRVITRGPPWTVSS